MASYSTVAARAAQRSAEQGDRTPDAAANKFLGTTDRTPRPTHDPAKDGPFGGNGREQLAHDQRNWDAAKQWDLDNAARRHAHITQVDAKREAERQARRDEDESRLIDRLRERFLDSDPFASESDFQADLVEIRRLRRIQAASADPAAGGRGRM